MLKEHGRFNMTAPELPNANTFSLRSRYSERASSRTKLLFNEYRQGKRGSSLLAQPRQFERNERPVALTFLAEYLVSDPEIRKRFKTTALMLITRNQPWRFGRR